MGQRKQHSFMSSATAASVSSKFRCDYRFDDGATSRTLYGILTSGAEVNVYLNMYNAEGSVILHHLEVVVSVGSSTYTTATNSFAEVFNGPIEEIEVVKAAGSGTATVFGLV